MNETQSYGLKIERRTFIVTVIILFCVMVAAFVMTQVIPTGSFERITTDGREIIVPGSYILTDKDSLPVWRLFTAPFEVLIGSDSITVIMIIIFLMLIGGAFLVLEKCGLLNHMLQLIIKRFSNNKYIMLAVITLFCMILGSTMGLFEETIILAPILVALALSLGWDPLVGMGMSLLAMGFGFAAGTFNPFTIGIAQQLAGLPLYSGLWLRIVVFILTYIALITFLLRYAKRIEKNPEKSLLHNMKINSAPPMQAKPNDENIDVGKQKKALVFFCINLSVIAVYIILGLFMTSLTMYTIPVMAVFFTVGGIGAGFITGTSKIMSGFGKGMVSFIPGAFLIMLAMSSKQIIVSGGIMDTLMYYAYTAVVDASPFMSLIIIFAFVLLMELFIASSSAKAFMIIPLIAPLAELIGLTRQSVVLAFSFGDGFANVIYPTNAVLLVVLGIIGVPFTVWFKWTWKLQAVMLLICTGLLFLAYYISYGPF